MGIVGGIVGFLCKHSAAADDDLCHPWGGFDWENDNTEKSKAQKERLFNGYIWAPGSSHTWLQWYS